MPSYYVPYLVHDGIKGMKWGIRRYQNPDGTLTEAGKERYRKYSDKKTRLETKVTNQQYALSKTEKKLNRAKNGSLLFGPKDEQTQFELKQKASSQKIRLLKSMAKAEKWNAKMERKFRNVTVSDISQSSVNDAISRVDFDGDYYLSKDKTK